MYFIYYKYTNSYIFKYIFICKYIWDENHKSCQKLQMTFQIMVMKPATKLLLTTTQAERPN